ncbi:hypothetical protein OGY35_14370 [Citrobacter sp. Ct235]|uniref:hypothetical protein n=1 Tax=Citrobacter sp. Ct235 TaxID=2985157 RepID=UPI0025778E6D|nr:hypothetical protein [Citrobacter sp. Ct235]MDM2736553.1 hypothetical protein [Citrobacter sp. Ct235]
MSEFNKYESFYITTAEILQDLITETMTERQSSGRGCCDKYQAGYLTALYRVDAAVKRQAYLFDITSEEVTSGAKPGLSQLRWKKTNETF